MPEPVKKEEKPVEQPTGVNLSEKEEEALRKEIFEELSEEESGKKKDAEDDDDKEAAVDDESDDSDTSKDEEDTKKDDEEEASDKKDDDAGAEKKDAKDETPDEKKKKEDDAKAALEKEISDYATAQGVSVDEARQDVESIGRILEKFKGDSKQLAQANLHLQRLYSKTKEELKSAAETKPSQSEELTTDTVVRAIEEGTITHEGKPLSKEAIITMYRENNQDITEELGDDAVMKLAAKEIREQFLQKQKEYAAGIVSKAKDKRASLIAALSDSDRAFLPDIKPILDKTSDAAVMNENFSLADMVLWAKGRNYEKAVKEHGEREYQRGLQEAKILKKKSAPSGDGGKKKSGKRDLSLEEKQRAIDMYSPSGLNEEECYDAYRDYLENDKK